MLLTMLGFSELIESKEIYPHGKPLHGRHFRLNGVDACTIKARGNYTNEEFEFLKQYAYYHCAAPDYGYEGKVLADKFARVKTKVNFYYLVANALVKGIDIF